MGGRIEWVDREDGLGLDANFLGGCGKGEEDSLVPETLRPLYSRKLLNAARK